MLMEKIKRYRRYRETLSQLSKLSDRELSDLGISRCDIPRLVKEIST